MNVDGDVHKTAFLRGAEYGLKPAEMLEEWNGEMPVERTVRVQGGDCLSRIAEREMGRGDSETFMRLYRRNEKTILSECRKRGVAEWCDRHGFPFDEYSAIHWIFPGMELVIPAQKHC